MNTLKKCRPTRLACGVYWQKPSHMTMREQSSTEKTIKRNPSCINLLHVWMNWKTIFSWNKSDYLGSGRLSERLSTTQRSTLVFVLLTSEEKMDMFDLKTCDFMTYDYSIQIFALLFDYLKNLMIWPHGSDVLLMSFMLRLRTKLWGAGLSSHSLFSLLLLFSIKL